LFSKEGALRVSVTLSFCHFFLSSLPALLTFPFVKEVSLALLLFPFVKEAGFLVGVVFFFLSQLLLQIISCFQLAFLPKPMPLALAFF